MIATQPGHQETVCLNVLVLPFAFEFYILFLETYSTVEPRSNEAHVFIIFANCM